ncbi:MULTISPECIES: alkaline phosphatase PhoX [unclassified Streptomyces]|uniref:PhoX family protein n=1 Tax=unclassified Streptomyces TaxID=2593676 RepID=UPI001EF8A988|nr:MULTISPECIES: alkaline phosphatase PhoX [unclassified Streptomyces]
MRRGATGKAGPDEGNPCKGNKHGHILELDEHRSDAAAKTFRGRLMLVCGSPAGPSAYFAGYDKSQVSAISGPDTIAFDEHGNLWLATDGGALGSNDGLFAVPVKGPERGHVKQFLTVPKAAETGGPIVTGDRILITAQHPGEADGSTTENLASHWPDGPGGIPRPSVATVWKNRHRILARPRSRGPGGRPQPVQLPFTPRSQHFPTLPLSSIRNGRETRCPSPFLSVRPPFPLSRWLPWPYRPRPRTRPPSPSPRA